MADKAELVPGHKQDLAAAHRAVDAGWPTVEPVLTALVSWCVDGNWPVAQVLGPFLGRLGVCVAPAVREVLDGEDATAKYHILLGIVASFPPDELASLRPSLVRLRDTPTATEVAEEIPELARDLLAA